MKVVIDARFYGLEHTGLGRYTINLVNELAKLDKKNKYTLLLRKKYFDLLKVPHGWKKVLADFRHYTLAEQIKLPGIISAQKPDLVHFLHLNVPFLYLGKFVVTIHDMTMHRQGRDASTLPLSLYYAKRLPYKLIFKKAVFASEKIIVPSYAVKKEIVRYFGTNEEKIVTVYEGLDADFIKEVSREEESQILVKHKLKGEKYFLYVGNAYPHKNLERAVESIVFLNKKAKKRTSFVIVFPRDVFSKRLEKSIGRQGAEKYVKLLEFVPDKELKVLLKNSIAFVYPSLSEGFGLQCLESIAAGTLVLASDIPVFKEVYGNHVFYFNPFDFSSIAKSMEEAINFTEEEKQKLIKKGQKFIKRYSWTKTAKQTLKVYREAYQR